MGGYYYSLCPLATMHRNELLHLYKASYYIAEALLCHIQVKSLETANQPMQLSTDQQTTGLHHIAFHHIALQINPWQ